MVYDLRAELNANQFHKAGHTFAGWSLSENGEVKYRNCEEVGNLSEKNDDIIVLYAIWAINSITITFDAETNGGTTPVPSEVIYFGETLSQLPNATKEYYKFSGWFTSPSGGSQVSLSTKFFEDTIIYAQFVIDSSCGIKVGGTWKKGIPYVKVNGQWEKGYAWVKVNGNWKQGIG